MACKVCGGEASQEVHFCNRVIGPISAYGNEIQNPLYDHMLKPISLLQPK
jgi:hypothetical protein